MIWRFLPITHKIVFRVRVRVHVHVHVRVRVQLHSKVSDILFPEVPSYERVRRCTEVRKYFRLSDSLTLSRKYCTFEGNDCNDTSGNTSGSTFVPSDEGTVLECTSVLSKVLPEVQRTLYSYCYVLTQ